MTEVLVTTKAVRPAKLQSNCHQQQTNTQQPTVTGRTDTLPVAEPTASQHWREIDHIPRINSPGSLPTSSLTTKGSWLGLPSGGGGCQASSQPSDTSKFHQSPIVNHQSA